MIIRPAETYRRVAEKHKLDRDLVVSIGEAVFTDLMEHMNSPSHLAYELDHVGTFGVRHSNFNKKLGWHSKTRPDSPFMQGWTRIPALIQEYKDKKEAFKTIKSKWNEKKEAREQGKD